MSSFRGHVAVLLRFRFGLELRSNDLL